MSTMATWLHEIIDGIRTGFRALGGDPNPTATPADVLRRPDRLAIAVMEYEELGIEPEPGTAAALVIGLRALSRAGISIDRTEQQ